MLEANKNFLVIAGKSIHISWTATEEDWREAFAEVKRIRGMEEHERRKAEQRKST